MQRIRSSLVILLAALLLGPMLAGCAAPTATPAPTSAPVAAEEPANTPEPPPTATPAPTEEPTAEPTAEPTEAASAATAITVHGQEILVSTLEQVSAEVETPKGERVSYTGVRLVDVLEAADAQGKTLTLIASDGYSVDVPMADVTPEMLLAYGDGGLDAVMPGLSGGAWVRSVAELSTASDDEVITITDALGREVTFAEYPHRITVPGKGAWMVGHPLYLFSEARERVLSMEARRGKVSSFLSVLVPGFDDLPHLETDAGPEQIAPLEPDCIVMKSYMASSLGALLEEVGFPTVYVDLETPEQYMADIRTIGALFDNAERAEEIVAYYKAKLDMIASRIQDVDEADRPTVLVVQHDAKAEEVAFEVPSAEYIQTVETELAGGKPVWTDEVTGSGWQIVNLEQIAAWDPDVVLVIVFQSDPEPVMQNIKNDPAWQALTAVQNDRIFAYPADYYGWDVPDPRWILGTIWAATKLHPDLFTDVDILTEVEDFYTQMYGMDKESISELVVPMITGDVQ
ncbi:MAG TPA: ABC transporter substrate-binding protein [Chloroflexi bacterium]|jgi:iron complex transport system substrate-binding protein|nr:ABC transporter substrate-binding protein [Chloroflexota bacterium]